MAVYLVDYQPGDLRRLRKSELCGLLASHGFGDIDDLKKMHIGRLETMTAKRHDLDQICFSLDEAKALRYFVTGKS